MTKFDNKEMFVTREFFGFGGYTREPEGFLSWQHLLFVGSLLVLMTIFAIRIGRNNRQRTPEQKNRVLAITALWLDGFEVFKLVLLCVRSGTVSILLENLPLYLCSIQLIAVPLAAFSKGRIREAARDFVCIFGVLSAFCGTVCAGHNFSTMPVLSFDCVVSGITHSLSGFAALYIMFADFAGLKRENMAATYGILLFFCVLAYASNMFVSTANYMFLRHGEGTPYDLVYNLVNGNQVLYPLLVVGLFVLYITGFYYVVNFLRSKHSDRSKVACSVN